MNPATNTDVICPLWRRWIALVYDLVAVLAIVMVVGLVCQLATGGRLITVDTQVHIAWWYRPLQALVVAAYFIVSWLRGGQTLGMRPWRIRVTNGMGAALSTRQALIRAFVAALPLLLLLLAPVFGIKAALWAVAAAAAVWLATALLIPRRRTVYDLAAGTEMRRIG
jgi:uncharacterized RDD family membrane protein YckC